MSSTTGVTMGSPQLIPIRPFFRYSGVCLSAVAALWRVLNRFKTPRPQRIILLDPVGLGDIVTCEPLIRQLLAANYETVVCSKKAFKVLFEGHPKLHWADLHVPFASTDEGAKYALKYYFSDPFRSDFRKLHQESQGAVGLDLRGDIRCVLLLYAVGCRRVISLSNYLGSDLHMSPSAAEIVAFDHTVRRWQLNLRFLDKLRGECAPCANPPELKHLICRKDGNRVGFVPIAPWPGKWWLKSHWVELGKSLQQSGFQVTVLCGPNQRESAAAQVDGFEIQECATLGDWIRELNNCRCLITVDSGPMHLADAMDVPLVALFGQGKLPLWAPSGPRSRFIHHQSDPDFAVCQPIFQNIPLGQKFMNRITVEQVLKGIEEVLA